MYDLFIKSNNDISYSETFAGSNSKNCI